MTTKYVSKYVNEYKQLNVYKCLCKIRELCKFKLYYNAQQMIVELYEIYCHTSFDDINDDFVVFTFDDECEMFLLIDKIAKYFENKK